MKLKSKAQFPMKRLLDRLCGREVQVDTKGYLVCRVEVQREMEKIDLTTCNDNMLACPIQNSSGLFFVKSSETCNVTEYRI